MVWIRGKFRHFPLPRDKILPASTKRCWIEKARIKKNILTSFRPPRFYGQLFLFPPALLPAFNGPGRAEVRTGPAVGAKSRIDPGTVFPFRNGSEGAGREAVPAIRAFFGNLVRHKLNKEQNRLARLPVCPFARNLVRFFSR